MSLPGTQANKGLSCHNCLSGFVGLLVTSDPLSRTWKLLLLESAVVIHLKPTGGAPVLKQLKFKVCLQGSGCYSVVYPGSQPSRGYRCQGTEALRL